MVPQVCPTQALPVVARPMTPKKQAKTVNITKAFTPCFNGAFEVLTKVMSIAGSVNTGYNEVCDAIDKEAQAKISRPAHR